MLRQRSLLLLLFAGLLMGLPLTASAQSVDAVVENMRAQYEKQLQTVDTYIVETNLYTSYTKKVTKNGESTYDTRTKMNDESNSSFASSTTPSAAYGLQLDRLKQHATYGGTKTIDDTEVHVLEVDDPAKVNPDMKEADADRMTYYVDTERHVPIRLVMNTESKAKKKEEPKTSTVTVNMKNYQTVDGLTLPYRMEFSFDMDMTEKQRQQMAMIIKKMEQMPENESDRMKEMMGDQVQMMKQMLSGEPMVVEVKDVKVNTEIPSGIF